MYAPQVAAAQPAAAARHGGRRPPWGGGPVPRLALVRVSLVAASARLGVTIAVTITAETRGKLTAPGGLATSRNRFDASALPWRDKLAYPVIEPGSWVMERTMLLTIKQLAEHLARTQTAA